MTRLSDTIAPGELLRGWTASEVPEEFSRPHKGSRKPDCLTRDLECRPRECAVCGRTFSPPRATPGTRTCPECVAAGRKAKGRRSAGSAACEMCGREFERYTRHQRLCHECSVKTNGNGDRRKNED